MSTIHNPVNFNPQDYQVVTYIDNRPPEGPRYWTKESLEAWNRALAAWRAEVEQLNVQGGICQCCHCGNGTVRFVAICLHKPTGRNVCFGDICVDRLNLPGRDAFKAKHIRTHAANEAARLARLAKVAETFEKNPGLEEAFKTASPSNTFVADVFAKLMQYGELSERQIAAVFASIQRDIAFTARRAEQKAQAGPIPTGKRIEFSGVIVSRRVDDSPYGQVIKCLIRLDNGGKIWGTQPAVISDRPDDYPVNQTRVTIRATVTAKEGEPTFGFMNRPHVLKVEKIS